MQDLYRIISQAFLGSQIKDYTHYLTTTQVRREGIQESLYNFCTLLSILAEVDTFYWYGVKTASGRRVHTFDTNRRTKIITVSTNLPVTKEEISRIVWETEGIEPELLFHKYTTTKMKDTERKSLKELHETTAEVLINKLSEKKSSLSKMSKWNPFNSNLEDSRAYKNLDKFFGGTDISRFNTFIFEVPVDIEIHRSYSENNESSKIAQYLRSQEKLDSIPRGTILTLIAIIYLGRYYSLSGGAVRRPKMTLRPPNRLSYNNLYVDLVKLLYPDTIGSKCKRTSLKATKEALDYLKVPSSFINTMEVDIADVDLNNFDQTTSDLILSLPSTQEWIPSDADLEDYSLFISHSQEVKDILRKDWKVDRELNFHLI